MRTIELSKDGGPGSRLCCGPCPHSVGEPPLSPGTTGHGHAPGGGVRRRVDKPRDLCFYCWKLEMERRLRRNEGGEWPPYELLDFWGADR